MTRNSRPGQLALGIEAGLRAIADPERAEGARRYLKSDLEFIGVATPDFRAVLKAGLRAAGALDRATLLAAAGRLWARPVFELRSAAVEILALNERLLEPRDLGLVERMLRESRTWALVDSLAPHVVGPMVERLPELGAALDRWAADPDFWLRRAAMLALLIPLRRGAGDWTRFVGYADAMLDEREFFIRKAIGWVLREVSKKRPALVAEFLAPRMARASGVTLREALRYLPEPDRTTLAAARGARPRRAGALAAAALLALASGFAAAAPPDAAGRDPRAAAVAEALAGTPSAFVVCNPDGGDCVRFDAARCRTRFSPFSTFKVPNSLIALETKVVTDAELVLPWDSSRHPRQPSWPAAWAGPQSLRSAVRDSVVWFFQDVAMSIGPQRMAEFLRRFDYGNQDISGGQDRFWLGSSLRISADEQVRFLGAFLRGRLGLSPDVTATMKSVLVLEDQPGYRLSGKTGTGSLAPGRWLGWLVGYVERGGRVFVFAFNTEAPSFAEVAKRRGDLARRALVAAGALPDAALPAPAPAH
ncbi:MAG TPA: DNA alkylation repair protein [Thermoanaerobaculaceae bacterium]|nr:DNA alkylation repair protein [Thermoanaerobaculaceae bacterium]